MIKIIRNILRGLTTSWFFNDSCYLVREGREVLVREEMKSRRGKEGKCEGRKGNAGGGGKGGTGQGRKGSADQVGKCW